MEGFLTVSEAAKLIGVNTETLRRWDKSGKFSSSRNPINNYRVYRVDHVHQFIREIQLQLEHGTEKIDNTTENTNVTGGKPFFETQHGVLYNLDVIEFLKPIDSESVDLIFADPPYNIKKAEWDSFTSQQQYVEWIQKDPGQLFKHSGSNNENRTHN